MAYVKKWRQLVSEGKSGRKYNYQEAAVVIGLSKKSLDDYYYQLRAGEKYGFDFESHKKSNIKVLRNFVKEKIPKRKGTQN